MFFAQNIILQIIKYQNKLSLGWKSLEILSLLSVGNSDVSIMKIRLHISYKLDIFIMKIYDS